MNHSYIFRAVIGTNRGNFLLIKILQHRYPNLFSVETITLLEKYLSAIDDAARHEILTANEVDETLQAFVTAGVEGWDGVYPCKLGKDIQSHKVKQQLVLFLVSTKRFTESLVK
jgi:hypothetical protein